MESKARRLYVKFEDGSTVESSAIQHHPRRPASPSSPPTRLYVYNSLLISHKCPGWVPHSGQPKVSQKNLPLPLWSSWHGSLVYEQINPIWGIAQEACTFNPFLGPGFNSACEPSIPLFVTLGVNLFAPDASEIAFDRLYSEVVE
jgi:hypothetical protein